MTDLNHSSTSLDIADYTRRGRAEAEDHMATTRFNRDDIMRRNGITAPRGRGSGAAWGWCFIAGAAFWAGVIAWWML